MFKTVRNIIAVVVILGYVGLIAEYFAENPHINLLHGIAVLTAFLIVALIVYLILLLFAYCIIEQ